MQQRQAQVALAAYKQFGLVTRRKLHELGFSRDVIDYGLRTGEMVRVHRSVYRMAGAPITFEQLLMAAVLAAGTNALVSHRAAAWVWRLEGIRAGRPEISIPLSRKIQLAGVRVHRVAAVPKRDITKHRGLPVTTAARTVADIAGMVAPDSLEDALDDGLRRKLFTVESLKKQIEGRTRNTSVLRRLLAERAEGKVSGSSSENALRRLLYRAQLPKPVQQYEIRCSDGSFIARVDFAYPDERLVIEYDGAHHSDPRQWRSDLARQNRLINAGWRILRYTHDDLVHRPNEVVAEVRAALGFAQTKRAAADGPPS